MPKKTKKPKLSEVSNLMLYVSHELCNYRFKFWFPFRMKVLQTAKAFASVCGFTINNVLLYVAALTKASWQAPLHRRSSYLFKLNYVFQMLLSCPRKPQHVVCVWQKATKIIFHKIENEMKPLPCLLKPWSWS